MGTGDRVPELTYTVYASVTMMTYVDTKSTPRERNTLQPARSKSATESTIRREFRSAC